MKILRFLAAVTVAALPASAQSLRWVGLDMNSIATSALGPGATLNTRHAVTATLGGLTSLSFGPGPNLSPLSGSATVDSGTGNAATTSWNLSAGGTTLRLGMNHALGEIGGGSRSAGAEGVIYFFALEEGTLTVTYDYGDEQTLDPDAPYKVQDRGYSRARVMRNSRGLGDGAWGVTEMVNRDGSRTFSLAVGPADDLLALQFDFRLDDAGGPTSITGGYLTMSFTPIPEPSAAVLVALGALGLLGARRCRKA
ncbi:MAG: PEP-CTERM sorting domain-containing protein [Chloroflexaceae bacterium]|nr:PEP-CTERM sorting domain-containing protein [Chloroflexaceae bacterium]